MLGLQDEASETRICQILRKQLPLSSNNSWDNDCRTGSITWVLLFPIVTELLRKGSVRLVNKIDEYSHRVSAVAHSLSLAPKIEREDTE